MQNNKNKKSVKFQGDMLNFCDFIQVFVFTTNHHLKSQNDTDSYSELSYNEYKVIDYRTCIINTLMTMFMTV